MSRSGYSVDSCGEDNPAAHLWPCIVLRAIKGKRGQAFLQELAREMDAMPVKELITKELVSMHGKCCTLGVVCKSRGIDVDSIDIYDPQNVGDSVGISRAMAEEIEYLNDEYGSRDETQEQRWIRMRQWVQDSLKENSTDTKGKENLGE